MGVLREEGGDSRLIGKLVWWEKKDDLEELALEEAGGGKGARKGLATDANDRSGFQGAVGSKELVEGVEGGQLSART